MAEKTTKTTTKDLDIFVDECNRWIAFWGLTEWEIDIERYDIQDAYGQTEANIPARQATISLCEKWPDGKPSEHTIRDTAFHEICEILLCTLGQMAEGNWCSNGLAVEAERHAIIQRLRNCVWSRSEYVDE